MQLDANGKRRLRSLWIRPVTIEEISLEMDLSMSELARAAAMLGLPEREEPEVYMPTELQIKLAAAEIRASWTQQEREDRLKAAHTSRGPSGTIKDTEGHNAAAKNSSRSPSCDNQQKRSADTCSSQPRGRRGSVCRPCDKKDCRRGRPSSLRRHIRLTELHDPCHRAMRTRCFVRCSRGSARMPVPLRHTGMTRPRSCRRLQTLTRATGGR